MLSRRVSARSQMLPLHQSPRKCEENLGGLFNTRNSVTWSSNPYFLVILQNTERRVAVFKGNRFDMRKTAPYESITLQTVEHCVAVLRYVKPCCANRLPFKTWMKALAFWRVYPSLSARNTWWIPKEFWKFQYLLNPTEQRYVV